MGTFYDADRISPRPTFTTGCYVALHLVRRFVEPRLGRAAAIPRVGIVTAGAALLFVQADFTGPFRWVDRRSESSWREWEITSYLSTHCLL